MPTNCEAHKGRSSGSGGGFDPAILVVVLFLVACVIAVLI